MNWFSIKTPISFISCKICLSCFPKNAETGEYEDDFIIKEPSTLIDNSELLDGHLPVIPQDDGSYLFRRGNVVEYLAWLNRFIRENEIYRLCKRANGPRWILAGYTEEQLACGENLKDIARFFDYAETLNVVYELPEIPTDEEEIDEDGFSGYTYGDLFLPSPDVEEFQERFVRPELAKVFWCFATDALKGETCEHLACDLQADLDTAPPYASAHVFLEESIEDMGDLYPVGEYTFMGVYDSSKQYEPYSVVWKNDRLSVAVDNGYGFPHIHGS